MISGNDGILTRAGQAKDATSLAKAEEALKLSYLAALGSDQNFDDEKFILEAKNAGYELLPDSKIATDKSYIITVDGKKHQVTITDNGVEISKNVISDDTTTEDITFSTEWGTIDIVWLDLNNNVISEPLSPANYLSYQENELTPVIYDSTKTDNDENGEFVDTTDTSKGNWYDYNGVEDQNKWANAKTANGSYFVWIPRYAYKIIYYSSTSYIENKDEDGNVISVTPTGNATGFYDGYGQWKAESGEIRLELDDGIETVDVGDEKYIVHPAFMKDTGKKDSNGNEIEDYARGGWSEDLAGFWCAKYEASGSQTEIKFEPNVLSLCNMKVGARYSTGITATYGYSDLGVNDDGVISFMHSHMMKIVNGVQ